MNNFGIQIKNLRISQLVRINTKLFLLSIVINAVLMLAFHYLKLSHILIGYQSTLVDVLIVFGLHVLVLFKNMFIAFNITFDDNWSIIVPFIIKIVAFSIINKNVHLNPLLKVALADGTGQICATLLIFIYIRNILFLQKKQNATLTQEKIPFDEDMLIEEF